MLPFYIDSLDTIIFLNVVECVTEDEFSHWIKFMSIEMGSVVQFIRIINRIYVRKLDITETNLSTLKSVETLDVYVRYEK